MVAAALQRPAAQTSALSGWVQVFQAGDRRGEPYTLADLDDMARNVHELKGRVDPPAVLGHSETQPWLTDSGLPAAGWVADARRRGEFLEVRFADMPPKVRRLLELKAYRKASAEIYHEDRLPEGVQAKGKVLRRVSFLGGQLPWIKTLADVTALWDESEQFSESEPRETELAYTGRQQLAGGTWEVFFECHCGGATVDRQALVKQLTDAGYSENRIKALGGLADEAFASYVAEAVKKPVVVGHSAIPVAIGAPVPVAEPVVPALAAQFAEFQAKAAELDRRLAASAARQQAEERESQRRQQAERGRTVEAFCERWNREGYVLPREVDKTSKTPNLYHRLMTADGSTIRRFGETDATEFDSLVAEIEGRGPGFARRHFSEQIEQPAGGKDSVDEEAKRYAERRNKKSA